MNRELLIKVRDQIAAHPEHFAMSSFFYGTPTAIKNFVCGTTACIAGWAMLLAPQEEVLAIEDFGDDDHANGRDLLQLTEHQADRLFYADNWPEPYKTRYLHSNNNEDAEIAAAYINHILENGIPA